MGSSLTNKYAEGLPGKRYYGGCEIVDQVEQLAIDRAKQLFDAEHANVQPHSGAQANYAAMSTFLKPGDTFLGMDLSNGGHLTHGSPVNFSGMLYHAVSYGVTDEGLLDYDDLRRKALEHRPKLVIAGYSAYSRVIDSPRSPKSRVRSARCSWSTWRTSPASSPPACIRRRFRTPSRHDDDAQDTARSPRRADSLQGDARQGDRQVGVPRQSGRPARTCHRREGGLLQGGARAVVQDYARSVISNARALAASLASCGFQIVSGGTDNHLMLVDLRSRGLTGKVAQTALDAAAITVNKNTVPKETQSPFVTSGIRVGTSAVTTRGMGEREMARIASLIDRVLAAPDDKQVVGEVREEVHALTKEFPLYA